MKPKIAEIWSLAGILLPQLGDDSTECSTYIPECVIKAGYLGSDNNQNFNLEIKSSVYVA